MPQLNEDALRKYQPVVPQVVALSDRYNMSVRGRRRGQMNPTK